MTLRYRLGIAVGVLGAALAALFTVCNKRVSAGRDTLNTLLYEMLGGAVGSSLLLPFYLALTGHSLVLPPPADILLLLLLSLFCTVFLYVLQIQVLRSISAFTVNLTYNLEPVYSIIIAMLFLGEAPGTERLVLRRTRTHRPVRRAPDRTSLRAASVPVSPG